MADLIVLGFLIANCFLAFGGLVMTLWGQHFFGGGLLAKTLRRGTLAALLIFLHFFIGILVEVNFIEHSFGTMIGSLLEFAFMVTLAYVTYGFISDWKTPGS